MAFGFPAYHTESYSAGAKTVDWQQAVKGTLYALSWSIREETHDRIIGSTSMNIRSWGEKVFIDILPDNSITVTSKCALPTQCVDWGKNKDNVVRFMAELTKHV